MNAGIKIVISLTLAAAASIAGAQAYPVKPVHIVVGFPAGGPLDVVARILSPRFFEGSGQQVIIDNRAGANGIIATDYVAKSAPDGYTVFFGTTGNLGVNPSLYPKLPFDINKDFTPLTQVSSVSSLLYLHPSLPAKTLAEFIAYVKANPGKVNFSSSGSGGIPHLAGELFNSLAGVKTTHVPYKGTAPAFTALLAGEVQFGFSAVATGLQYVKTGKLKAIAAMTKKRLALLPDVPTANETLPGFEVDNWYGMVVPAGTPNETVMQLYTEVARVINLGDIREKLLGQGIEVVGSTPSEFSAFMKAEIVKWGRVVKEGNIRPE